MDGRQRVRKRVSRVNTENLTQVHEHVFAGLKKLFRPSPEHLNLDSCTLFPNGCFWPILLKTHLQYGSRVSSKS